MSGTERARDRVFTMVVALAGLAGLAGRFWYLERARSRGIGGDGYDYLMQARSAGRDGWYLFAGEPTAHHPPGWSTVLSAARVVLDIESVIGLQRFTSVIGAVTVVAIGFLGRRVAGRRVGVVAAVIAAVYPGMWVFERDLLAEPLALLTVTLMIWAFYRLIEAPGAVTSLIAALAVTLAGLTRAELMGAGVALVGWIWWRSGKATSERLRMVALCAVPLLVLLTPWVVFNLDRFEEPVLLSNGMGTTMAAGSCDETFSGDRLGYFDPRCTYRRVLQHPEMDASQLDGFARDEAIAYNREHLSRLPVVVLAREARSFGLYRPFQDVELTAKWTQGSIRPLQAWAVGYLALLPFGVAGAVLLRRRGRAIFPLVMPVALVAVATSFTFGQLRYRTVAEVSLVVLASVAFAQISRRLPVVGTGAPSFAVAPDGDDVVSPDASAPGRSAPSKI